MFICTHVHNCIYIYIYIGKPAAGAAAPREEGRDPAAPRQQGPRGPCVARRLRRVALSTLG